eukprot:jgi/Botrbrau1/23142/Bobra.0414s0001.1
MAPKPCNASRSHCACPCSSLKTPLDGATTQKPVTNGMTSGQHFHYSTAAFIQIWPSLVLTHRTSVLY